VWLKSVGAPDALHGRDADAGCLRHRCARPMRGFRHRRLHRQGHDAFGDGGIKLRDAEKSQIQVLDRTQPGLPMKTHDYKRNGTTTLFAAMNVLDGTVIGRNMQRHRHQEFIRFLNAVEREVPAGKTVQPRQLCRPQAPRA
jgi:hypothetical protein